MRAKRSASAVLSSMPVAGPAGVGASTPSRGSEQRRRRAAARCGRGRGSTRGGAAGRSRSAAWACSCGAQCSRERHLVASAERVDREQLGDPAAAGDVGLQDVDGAGGEHPLEVGGVVAVLAGRDLHPGRGAVAQQPQALEIVGGDRLLEPAHAACSANRSARAAAPACARRRRWRRRTAPPRRRSPRAPRAHALGVVARDRLPTFIFTRGIPACDPAGELLLQALDAVAGEAAAAVDRDRARAPRPAACASGSSSSRALRSQSATSTALIAIAPTPGRPRLRTALVIAHQAALRRQRVGAARRRRRGARRSAARSRGRRRCSRRRARRPPRRGRRRSSSRPSAKRAVGLGRVGRDGVGGHRRAARSARRTRATVSAWRSSARAGTLRACPWRPA